MSKQPSGLPNFLKNPRNSIWFIGTSSWLFGMADRGIAALADGCLSAVDFAQLFTAAFFFVGWLFLKPMPSRL